MSTYTRIELEVISNTGDYSFKINEEPSMVYDGSRVVYFGNMENMKAVAEAMLKVVEYSSNK